MRLALILKTDAQGSIAAVKHMFSEVTLVCMGFQQTYWEKNIHNGVERYIMDLTSAPIFVESSSNLQVCSYVSGTHLFKSFLVLGETQST